MTSNNAATQQVGGRLPAAGPYRLDPGRSSVTFRTRHLFGPGAASGTMAINSGEITLDPAAPHASVTAVMNAASFSTGNRARDRDVRSPRFLYADQYPDIIFRGGMLSEARGRWMLAGDLEVRGVSKPVTLVIEQIEAASAGFRARASTRIDRYAFGLTASKGMAARHLSIGVTVVAERQ